MKTFLALGVTGLLLAGCVSNPNTLALSGIGAAGGGLLGSQIGKGKGRLASTIVGTILGAATGNHIGSAFDGVTHNRNAINRNALSIHKNANQIQQFNSQAQTHYPTSQSFYFNNQTQQPHSVPLNCSIRNNYVVCNGS